MADDKVKYDAIMTRKNWRDAFLRAQLCNPTHKASVRWLSDICAETYDAAKIEYATASGNILTPPFEGDEGDAEVKLELSRSAVQGLKFAAIAELTGAGGKVPANLMRRRFILTSLDKVGPAGALRRLVEKESQLRDVEASEDELKLEAEAPPAEVKS